MYIICQNENIKSETHHNTQGLIASTFGHSLSLVRGGLTMAATELHVRIRLLCCLWQAEMLRPE
jgi:hypothetical protein